MLLNYFIINPSYSWEHDNQGVPVAMDVGGEVIYTTRNINEKIISLIFKNKLPLWHIVHKMRLCPEMFKTNTQTNERAFSPGLRENLLRHNFLCSAGQWSHALRLIGAFPGKGGSEIPPCDTIYVQDLAGNQGSSVPFLIKNNTQMCLYLRGEQNLS